MPSEQLNPLPSPPAVEREAAIDCEGFGSESAGVKFDARLVGLVFEVD